MFRKFLTSLVALCVLAAQCLAQDVNGDQPAGPDLQFIGCTSSTSDLTTYTFSAHAVGNAPPSGGVRKTIVGAVAEDALTIYNLLTVTVGGDSADVIGDNRGNAAAPMSGAWAIVDNPSDTSEDIVLTYDEAIQGVTICVWAAYNLTNPIPVHYTNGSTTNGAGMTENHIGITNAVYTGMCFAVSGSAGFTAPTAGEGTVITESADTSTAEWQFSANTGRIGFRQGLTNFTSCDTVSDAVNNLVSSVLWRNGSEPRMYQVACFGDDADLTTYTETNIPTGIPHASRKTVVGILAQDAATNFNFSSGTIGGAASTELVETGTVGLLEASIYFLDSNSAGDHETIAITMSEAITGIGMCVWAIYNLNSNTATGSVANASNAAASMSGDVAATGGGVCAAIAGTHTVATAATWAGQSTYNHPGFDTAERGIAFALRWFAPGGTYDLDVDFAGTTADTAIASGCWR